MYEALLKSAPRDPSLLTAYAEVLGRCATKECLQKAQATWRTLESLSPAGSEPWLWARYHLCQTLLDAGDDQACRKLLSVTKLLYPKLGSDALRARFVELEAKSEQRPK